jgi:hypothetical protein
MVAKRIVANGNWLKTYVYSGNGCLEVQIAITDWGEDDVLVVYEDGLYKVYVNGGIKIAATNCIIKYVTV